MTKELTLNKFAAALVGLAMVAGLASAVAVERAHAQSLTLSDLVELFIGLGIITEDKAEDARTAVEGMGTTAPTAGTPSTSLPASMSCSFTRNLTVGATGQDVMDLQKLLNAKGYTVATAGAGSPGQESSYFGPATKAAVAKMQEAFASEILTPLGLSTGTGYFGASTRAKANALCTAAPTTPTTPTLPEDDEDPMEDDEDMDEDTDTTLSGEASLDTFEIDDADETDVEEGDEEVAVAEISVEFADGDAEISRLDLAFTDSEGIDSDAWDVFESFSLMVDDEEVATADAGDEDNYLGNEDLGVIRFTNLDVVGMEDEEVVITVVATIKNNLSAAELGSWDVTGDSMRFFDADGVATTETGTTITGESATFTIKVEGDGDDLDLKSSSKDPDASTVALSEDDSEEAAVFVFKLDAGDSDGDLTIEGIDIDFVLGSSTGAIDDVVRDVTLKIGSETFSAEDYDGSASTTVVSFDVDGDVTIEAGEEVEVSVVVEFEDMDAESQYQGVTLQASVDTTDIDVEGDSGEAPIIGGSDQSGEAHTLRSEGLVVDITSIEETESIKSVGGDDVEFGKYVFKFEVTAFGSEFYMDELADIVDYDVLVNGIAAASASSTATLSISGADTASVADKMIEEGETATFTLTVETAADVTGSTKVVINSVSYSAGNDTTEELSTDATPEDDWTSEALILN